MKLIKLLCMATLMFGSSAVTAQINVLTVDCTPFVSPGFGSFGPFNTMGMALQAVDQGADFNVTEVTPAAFRVLTAPQLSAFDLIAVNNHPTRIDCGSALGLGATWHGAVGVLAGGRVVLTSHDAPRFKLQRTPPAPPLFTGFEPFGTIDLVRQAALWAGGLPGTTGLLIFNDAARFPTVGGAGWNNPELNLPIAWGITDSDQSTGGFMPGGYTDILPAFQTHPVYDGTAIGGVVLSDLRFAPFSISSFSANIVDASFHSIFASFNPLIFTPTELLINAGNPDPGGFGVFGTVTAPGPDGTAITIIRNGTLFVDIDIKFCSNPNSFNCKKQGVLPVTIFGAGTFDVTQIDPATLELCLSDFSACTGAPKDWSVADRGDPSTDLGAAQCAIDPATGLELDWLNPDGHLDFDAAFFASEVKNLLGAFCSGPKNGASPTLAVRGFTFGGIAFQSVPVGDPGIDQLRKANK